MRLIQIKKKTPNLKYSYMKIHVPIVISKIHMNKILKFMDVNILYMSYTCVHVLVALCVCVQCGES